MAPRKRRMGALRAALRASSDSASGNGDQRGPKSRASRGSSHSAMRAILGYWGTRAPRHSKSRWARRHFARPRKGGREI
eukprot:11206256-Alexandrium_andersonii.AAC.1